MAIDPKSRKAKKHKKQATSKRPMLGKEGSVLEKKPKNKKNKKTGLYSLKTDKPRPKKEGSVYKKKMDDSAAANQLKELGKPSSKVEKKGPVKKTVARVARDYAANAAYDAEHGYNKEAKYEKKKLKSTIGSILSKHMSRNK